MSTLLTIYFTSDTHGYLFPTNFHDQQPRPMGLLSMRFPKDENTLIIRRTLPDASPGMTELFRLHMTGGEAEPWMTLPFSLREMKNRYERCTGFHSDYFFLDFSWH